MTARDDNPALHRIVVECDDEGTPESVRFVCDGGDDAPCHHYPACDCETWIPELHGWKAGQVISGLRGPEPEDKAPEPGHEDVQQPGCWIDPWFNAAIGHDPSDWLDAYDGPDDALCGEGLGTANARVDLSRLVDGPISVTFEGEYMTWEYADDAEAQS